MYASTGGWVHSTYDEKCSLPPPSNNSPGGLGTNNCPNALSWEKNGSAHNAELNAILHIDMGSVSTHPGIDLKNKEKVTRSAHKESVKSCEAKSIVI